MQKWLAVIGNPVRLIAAFWVVSCLAVTSSSGQVLTSGLGQGDDPISELRDRITAVRAETVVAEGAVDEATYLVGPGDVFVVSIGGPAPVQLPLTVGTDGLLLLPESGSVRVSALSLERVREVVIQALGTRYENVSVDLSLERPRQFFVHVTGAVPLPGKFLSSAISRVDDAVQLAYAKRAFDIEVRRGGRTDIEQEAIDRAIPHPSSERPTLVEGYRPSLRTITIRHLDGTSSSVDLLDYYASGNKDQNPYLRDGDVINVPPFNVDSESIRIDGPVPFPGTYPFRQGDRLSDIVRLADGGSGSTDQVRLVSGSSGEVVATLHSLAAIRRGEADDPLLSPNDFIRVPDSEPATAAVYGWVRYPGTYPIEAGKTSYSELLALAGGPKADADLTSAFVDRREPTLLKGQADASDLDFFSLAYYNQSKRARRVVIDLEKIVGGDDADMAVEDGDAIVVPRLEETVYVVGNVARPGYVPYVEGRTASHYIEAAGGRGPSSRSVVVTHGASGLMYSGDSAPVAPGSTVFVDRVALAETPDMQSLLITQQTSQRQLKLMSTQTIISGVSAIAAIITTFVAISR